MYGEEGSLCNNPEIAGEICRKLAAELPTIPILVKIGYLPDEVLRALFLAVYKHVGGFTVINTIPSRIMAEGQRSETLFPGVQRARAGVSGVAIRAYATEAARQLAKLTHDHRKDLENIGVGGISSAADVTERLNSGMKVVQLCTAVNLNPLIGQQIRKQLASPDSKYPEATFEGHVITFSDPNVKAAYKLTSEVCRDLGVPFDVGLDAIRHHWLDRYKRDRDKLRATKNAARGKAPEKSDIEIWIRHAVARGN